MAAGIKYSDNRAAGGTRLGHTFGPVGNTGFPARSITRRLGGKGTCGEWILAYQADQRKHLQAIVTAAAAHGHHLPGSRLSVPKNTPARSAHRMHVLTKEALMQKGYVDDPSDLCICDISGMNFDEVKSDELFVFDNLAYLCASDNQISLEALQTLPALEELELSLNGISSSSFSSAAPLTHTSFPHLLILDLSYNTLSDEAIVTLGLLPALKELHLTGNSIATLPADMSRPAWVTPRNENDPSSIVRFSKLEQLWLDDNMLTDTSTFAILAGLRKLRYLNMENNEIHAIPRLQLLESVTIGVSEAQGCSRSQDDAGKSDDGGTSTTPCDQAESKQASPLGVPNQGFNANLAPFPELQVLQLANNMIMSSQGLLACNTWPQLKELIITGNPIVNLNNGLPLPLKEELVDKCNITVIRTNQVSSGKMFIGKKAIKFKRVSTSPPPTIPKHPLLPALEAPPPPLIRVHSPTEALEYSGLDSLSDQSSIFSADREEKNEETVQNCPGIFLTQVQGEDRAVKVEPSEGERASSDGDMSKPESVKESKTPLPAAAAVLSVDEEFRARRREEKKRCSHLPEHYRGYEALMVEDDDMMTGAVPTDMDVYRCHRALQQALQCPMRTGISTGPTTRGYSGKAGSNQASAVAVSKVNEVLDQIKTHCTAVETNLADVLSKQPPRTPASVHHRRRSQPITQKESKQLFRELQSKYDEVRGKSLQSLAAAYIRPTSRTHRTTIGSSAGSSRSSRPSNQPLPPIVTK